MPEPSGRHIKNILLKLPVWNSHRQHASQLFRTLPSALSQQQLGYLLLNRTFFPELKTLM